MKAEAQFPSIEHEQAAEATTEFFSSSPDVEAVILVGSCARGKASSDTCLDITILVAPETPVAKRKLLEQCWDDFYKKTNIFKTLQKIGKYSHVDLSFIDGRFKPKPRDWTSGPDQFELEIGNALVYSVPLWERGYYLKHLKNEWLPYYSEALRKERLTMVRLYCSNNLDHIPLYVKRSIYFQAFDRLYNAFQEFLQALFISRRIYPIAYDKWIQEQIEEILGMPELYKQLPRLFEFRNFESKQITEKAKHLRILFENYVKE
jgi:predicted nucleotidyltransferase